MEIERALDRRVERPNEKPTEEELNRARLARAAHTILREIPRHAQNFGWAAGILMGGPNGDAMIAGMIEFTARLAREGREIVDAQIERDSGMRVQIEGSPIAEITDGRLVTIEGIGSSDNLPPGKKEYLKGTVVVEDRRGREHFMPVAVLEDGRVFSRAKRSPRNR